MEHGSRSPQWKNDATARFAEALRELRRQSGDPSLRELERRTHFSRTALSQAASGQKMPSLQLALAYVTACGGDPAEWTGHWERATAQARLARVPDVIVERKTPARPAWPPQALADGADPDRAGCSEDAVTVCAQRVGISEGRVVGQIQLRLSPWGQAVWARFEGTSSLDHLAARAFVEIELGARRTGLGETHTLFRAEYAHDYMWSDLLLAGERPVRAEAAVYMDGVLVGSGTTQALSIS
ncbi:helix-turn-helix domain-containing protein [Longispora albida]|uniref:helix-turn-helix domain-containing protein n=1 Tax=Longispora albida TaxID=203523 RepID=UPI0003A17617|nr:helix-turn-helix transcriptional regulator [Longispora albida]